MRYYESPEWRAASAVNNKRMEQAETIMETNSERRGWPSESAVKLAVDLERRGSLEGHYVWSEMIQRALDAAFSEGYKVGLAHDR